MNVKPQPCRCGADPITDNEPDGVVVYCPLCGLSFQGPDTFVTVVAWNRMISSYKSNIKDFEPDYE